MDICELPAGITLVDDPVPGLRITTPAAEGFVTLQGAHLTHWQPVGADPVLWTSRDSRFARGTAIRGGVPVCFPWFGPGRDQENPGQPSLDPNHGWARLVDWKLCSAGVDEQGQAELTFELDGRQVADQPHPELFPADAVVRYSMRLGAMLDLRLEVIAGEVLVDVEEALHVYFAVEDVPAPVAEWEVAIPLGRAIHGRGRSPARVVLYRRPIETRVEDPRDLAVMINDIVVEQIAGALGVEPTTLDPGYQGDADY